MCCCNLYGSFFEAGGDRLGLSLKALLATLDPTPYPSFHFFFRALGDFFVNLARAIWNTLCFLTVLLFSPTLALCSPLGVPGLVGALALDLGAAGVSVIATAVTPVMVAAKALLSFVVNGLLGLEWGSKEHEEARRANLFDFG